MGKTEGSFREWFRLPGAVLAISLVMATALAAPCGSAMADEPTASPGDLDGAAATAPVPDSAGGSDGENPGSGESDAGEAAPGRVQDGDRWRYRMADGAFAASCWLQLDGKWYHFGEDGFAQTGWLSDGGQRYYLDPAEDGAMRTGWYKVGGEWMWSDADGAWHANSWQRDGRGWWLRFGDGSYPASSWQLVDGKWYLFDGSGYMLTGWVLSGDSWYYLAPSGAMETGWQSVDGAWYYLDPAEGGAMATGWFDDGGTWYYLDGSGFMRTGWVLSGGSWYHLAPSGAMETGWQSVDGGWYYLDPVDGDMKTGWLALDDDWYYLNRAGDGIEGLMRVGSIPSGGAIYITDESGRLSKDVGWKSVGGVWYYVLEDGIAHLGWLRDDSLWYYLASSDGAMATDWALVGGVWYRFNGSGSLNAAESVIYQAESEIRANPFIDGRKYEDALMRAGGTLTYDRRGLWCVNFLWWCFHRIGMESELWGETGLQVDPDYLAQEAKAMGQYSTDMSGIRRGDIVFSYWSSWRPGIEVSHGAIVLGVNGSRMTIAEGNVGSPSLRVTTVDLYSDEFRGYFRPAYAS